MGDLGLRRAKYFMKLLGNPQNRLRVIHIAGTSGKGSTSYLMSHILRSQGFSVGLSISPHVLDIRERMQINNKLPSKKIVLEYFNEILPVILKMDNCKYGMPTFFEINVGLAYYMFAKAGLDYTVMETGLGGLLDATNTVTNKTKVSIITKIGFDHTAILGKKLSDIAFQKAAIIQNGNIVLSAAQHKNVYPVIEKMSEEKNADLSYVLENVSYNDTSASSNQKNTFDFEFENLELKNLRLATQGKYQQENCALALACLAKISRRDGFEISETEIRKTLLKTMISCRMETFQINGKTIIFDGAHNPQKMSALIKSLKKIYPDKKLDFLFACKKEKTYKEMLSGIIPIANKIYLTTFSNHSQDNPRFGKDPTELSKFLINKNFNHCEIITISQQEIVEILEKTNDVIAITGSFFLLAEVRKVLKKL